MSEATPMPPDPETDSSSDLAPESAPEPARPARAKRSFLWRWTRRLLMAIAALVAMVVVLFFRVDLGRFPVLKELAERVGSMYIETSLTIGGISALMTPGVYELTDVVIAGRAPATRPFFKAKRVRVHVPWWTILQTWYAPKRDIFVEVELLEWEVSIETWANNKSSMPRLAPKPSTDTGPRKFRTTAPFIYAKNGKFIYEDHATPWTVEAPNLAFALVRGQGTYLGDARFEKGTVTIQNFKPMVTDMRTRFSVEGGMVKLNHIDLTTDGTRSHVNGTVDFGNWPDQTYNVNSTLDFTRMREIFFPTATWRMSGQGQFAGVFKIFKAGGRDLSGMFTSDNAQINALRFPKLHGSLTWQPSLFAVNHAEAGFLGGDARFTYSLAPLGTNTGKPATATFSADYSGISAAGLDQLFDLRGLELGGQLSGSLGMVWPNGKFGDVAMDGHTTIAPPEGMSMAPKTLPAVPRAAVPEPAGDFDPYLRTRLSLGADLHYTYGPEGLTFTDSWAATRATYVAFTGRRTPDTIGDFAFHVTSHDWQESDRVLAGIMSAVSSRTRAIKVGGRGLFDGTMTGAFNDPVIKGRFTGEAMRVWDVTWGKANGDITINNGYVDITNSRITNETGGVIVPNGRFSLSLDRKDGGDEIKARVLVTTWPMMDFKVPFGLIDWPVDGTIGLADLSLTDKYKTMRGAGKLRIDKGVAWKEPFQQATGDLDFEGTGLVIRNLDIAKDVGHVTGAARIGWDNTYAFNATGERIPFQSLDNFRFEQTPLTGILQFRATGAGTFDAPTYSVDASIADLFIADEGIGLATAKMKIANQTVTFEQLNAASRRLQVFGSGSIAMNDAYDADLQFRFQQTSIDPYLRFVAPKMSPYTRAIVSGAMQIRGPLSTPADLFVDATIDELALTLFDYQIANDGQLRFSYEDQRFDATQLKLKGQDTSLSVTGGINVRDREIDMTASGDASLAILQLIFPALNTSGQANLSATFKGPLDQFRASGKAEIKDGRLRHLSIPQSLSNINGPITFDQQGVRLDGLKASLGTGPVDFGGTIAMTGFTVDDFNITANGRQMRISNYPEGLTSYVNADLALRGTLQALVLSGNADVYYARYVAPIDANEGWLALAAGLTSGGGIGTPLSLASAQSSGVPLTYDIGIHMGTQPIIQGNQASLDAAADLRISGSYDRPSITGDIDILGGEVSFNGYRYRVRRSLISLDNPNRIDPTFDLELDTRARAGGQVYDVTLRLAGTMARFTRTISSEPYLSEIDVISLLLGASPDVRETERRRIAPEQVQQQMMGQLLAQLAASTVTNRVGSVFTDAFPIDTMQITPVLTNDVALQTLNPSARITIGKRIANRVYLTYSRAVGALQDEIILIEYDQSNRISWVLSRNEDSTFALDFRFRYVF